MIAKLFLNKKKNKWTIDRDKKINLKSSGLILNDWVCKIGQITLKLLTFI